MCVRRRQVRRLVQEPDDRAAPALPGPRRHDLPARRADIPSASTLPAQVLFGLRGRLGDRGCAVTPHRHGSGPAVHRHPRRLHRCRRRRRCRRLRPHARLHAGAGAEEHRLREAVPACGRAGREGAGPRAGALRRGDQLGPDRPAVRPDREVPHRPCAWAPPGPGRFCAASPWAAPSTPLTRRSENVGGRCVPSSCATVSPVWRCGVGSTRGCRSWRSWSSADKDLFYGKGRRSGRGGPGVAGGVHARAPPARARPWSTSTRC